MLNTNLVQLPKYLRKSPIIDAVFDIRFNTSNSLILSIPGKILQKYPKAKVTRLPAYGMPEPVLRDNPEFQYVAMLRFELPEGGVFLCGERMVAIGFPKPYPGWSVFQEKIRELLTFLFDSEGESVVERMAIKYVDFIDCQLGISVKDVTTFSASLRGQDLTDKDFSFRISDNKQDVSYALQLVTNANVSSGDVAIPSATGLVIDSDTVLNLQYFYKKEKVVLRDLIERFDGIEYLHHQAKSVFFSTISETGLQKLGAVYDE